MATVEPPQRASMAAMDSRPFTSRLRAQHGGIVGSWLIQLVILMAVLAFVGYEGISVAVTAVRLDQTARDVAEAGADGYRTDEDLEDAENSAAAEAERQLAELVSIEESDGQIIIHVSKQAPTLVVHNIGALEGLTEPTARGRARWR